MRIRSISGFISGLALWAVCGLVAQTLSAQTWTLPPGMTVKDNGPRTYRFSVDYNTANTRGEVVYRQRVTGDYTRGLAGGEVMWKNVSVADVAGSSAPFPTAQKRDFMEGFRYRNDITQKRKIWEKNEITRIDRLQSSMQDRPSRSAVQAIAADNFDDGCRQGKL